MVFFTDSEIERLIEEDIPYIDLTTLSLGIGQEKGVIRFSPRGKTVVCCTEEVVRICERLHIKTTSYRPSGTVVAEGEVFFEAEGLAGDLHKAWRICLNLLEYSSGIATRTRAFVDEARAVNPGVVVATTRKSLPGARKIAMKGILSGGAVPHRLGLSETVLVFDEHLRFLGGLEKFAEMMPALQKVLAENKISIEVKSLADALKMAEAGVDSIQLDKLSTEDMAKVVKEVKQVNPKTLVIAAGGINVGNVKEYAGTGADILVTSFLYFGKPADIKAEILPL